jgi:hypothetical protein
MATTIVQKPLYRRLPVGQDVIFVVKNDNIVQNQLRVKFVAEVHISDTTVPNTGSSTQVVGTFKTTPNAAGVGIFNFRPIIESYVKADNTATDDSKYKDDITRHPVHITDKFSRAKNTVRFLAIKFAVEYLDSNNVLQTVDNISTVNYTIINGYLKYTDKLAIFNNDFGYSLSSFFLSSASDKFLTNAPATQYANLEDYGTLSLMAVNSNLNQIRLTYSNSAGTVLTSETVYRDLASGAYDSWSLETEKQLLHFGCFPGNLQNWSTTFNALVSAGTIQGGSISITCFDASFNKISKGYEIKLNCSDLKNYESIRLCWLNQWGAWDYYTFTKKSTKSLSTQGSTYEQLSGSWNEEAYRIDSFKGGKKAFRVNANEKITMNTNFVSESENVMFEELINSPEVYLLEGYQDDIGFAALNQYVTPVRLTTSSFTTKTVANDKLIQYSFEVEKTMTLRTQTV